MTDVNTTDVSNSEPVRELTDTQLAKLASRVGIRILVNACAEGPQAKKQLLLAFFGKDRLTEVKGQTSCNNKIAELMALEVFWQPQGKTTPYALTSSAGQQLLTYMKANYDLTEDRSEASIRHERKSS